MREWQVGDPTGDGNDIGVPDVKYMDYLKNKDDDAAMRNRNVNPSEIEKSKMYQDEAVKLYQEKKFYDALTFINAAIKRNPNDEENWNLKGIILFNIFMDNDKDVAFEAYESYNKALELDPYNKTIRNNKAMLLTYWALESFKISVAEAEKRVNEALSFFEDETCQEYPVALYIKAYILNVNRNYDEALDYINKGLKALPDDEVMLELRREILDNRNIF